MAAVDHGPQAPSIEITRMDAPCGVGLNKAMAYAVNVLGDVHGGAGEQAVALYEDIAHRVDPGGRMVDEAVAAALQDYRDQHGQFVCGFGHRFHPLVILNALFAWLTEAGYLAGSPLALARRRRAPSRPRITPYLSHELGATVKETVEAMAGYDRKFGRARAPACDALLLGADGALPRRAAGRRGGRRPHGAFFCRRDGAGVERWWL